MMMNVEETNKKLRFASAAQLAKMHNLSLPALIVPLGSGGGSENSWVFETTEGTIPCLLAAEIGTEMIEQPKGIWRFVPGGTAICVQFTMDKQAEHASFEKWLRE